MKKNFRIVLALLLALSMLLGMVPAMAEGEGLNGGDDIGPENTDNPPSASSSSTPKGSITINSPIMGAQYFAYQIFKMTLDDDIKPTAFGYFIDKDDPFFAAVWSYTEKGTKHLILTGIPSTKLATAEGDEGDIEFDEYTVTAAEDFKDVEGVNGVQAFGVEMQTAYNKMTEAQKQGITVYTPTYEKLSGDGDSAVYAEVITPAKAGAVTFEKLPYGYYLITNNYDDPAKRMTVKLEYLTETDADYQKWEFNKEGNTIVGKHGDDSVTVEKAAQAYTNLVYPAKGNGPRSDDPGLKEAQKYVTEHAAQFEKRWVDMTEAEQDQVLNDLRTSLKDSTVDQIEAAIDANISDDNAKDGTTGNARLIFIDSTTPNGVINEKNEYEKWDVPVNPQGSADLPDIPDHEEPKGGKNIVVGYTSDDKPIYANTAEYNIGDKVHYQLSVNAVNFERTKGDDPTSVKQIKEYIIADYENKNMKYVPRENGAGDNTNTTTNASYKYGLSVTIVKKDGDGNIVTAYTKGPYDYSSWVEDKKQFFINTDKTDLANDDNIFDNDANVGGILIPWVEIVTKDSGESDEAFLARIATMKNVTKNTVHKAGTSIAKDDYDALSNTEKAAYFQAEDGKYYAKVPVFVEAPADAVVGQKYKVNYDDSTEYTCIEVEGKKYLSDDDRNPLQATDRKTNELVWETEDVYFHSIYDDDVTILVDYWMELLDTAVIDGAGNPNTSQFGVDYVEPEDKTYTYNINTTPGNPPDEPKKPSEEKEQDDAVVYTSAIAIKKVDEDGKSLKGAEFQIKGLTAVTTKTDGWYKVKTYDRNATSFNGAVTLKTDDNGILVVDGFTTKWVVEIMETKAPEGYNILTKTLTFKPVRTATEKITTSKVTHTDENGKKTITETTAIVYLAADGTTPVAKKETINGVTRYYEYDANATGDDKFVPLVDIEGGETAAAHFTKLVNESDYAGDAFATDVAKPADIAELEIINQKGAELPSTGGMGTTIFYVAGSLMVLAAAILLITKRRMGAED